MEKMTEMLGFGLGSIAFATAIWLYLKKTRNWMKHFVLRYETIKDKVDDE